MKSGTVEWGATRPFALAKGARAPLASGAAALTLAWHADHGTPAHILLPEAG